MLKKKMQNNGTFLWLILLDHLYIFIYRVTDGALYVSLFLSLLLKELSFNLFIKSILRIRTSESISLPEPKTHR